MEYRFPNDGGVYAVRNPEQKSTPYFTGLVTTNPDRLSIPLKRRMPTVYAIWSDWAHEAVDHLFRRCMVGTALECPQHTFLALTKRPQSVVDFVCWMTQHPLNPFTKGHFTFQNNSLTGLTICNQQEADEKIPVFLQVPGKKFLSIEPMLAPISLRWLAAWNGMALKPRKPGQSTNEYDGLRLIDAVILGGETGPGARPLHPDWVRSIRDQCAAADVPFFFKQWGEWAFALNDATHALSINGGLTKIKRLEDCGGEWPCKKVGRKAGGRTLDGRTHDALPWVKG
jgi:protein gp37